LAKAYYNEIDPSAAAWLRELIAAGLIMAGDVDTRSIADVSPDDLVGYTRCHFFAGIGGWDYALRLAGWPDERPVWSGSCPCQPFSSAGAGKGFADDRHLWPEFFHLVKECRPERVFGEQAATALAWLDVVHADLEGQGYTVGAAVVGAHSAGADHIRQRIYWCADAGSKGLERHPANSPITFAGQPAFPWPGSVAEIARRSCEPDTSRLCDDYGLSDPVAKRCVKGLGNAIVPQAAAAFIVAASEALEEV
jgi:DNA (cytosine-5)-methyltransferase 1